MKRLATLVLISGLMAGCNMPLFTAGQPLKPGVNQPVEPLGGVTFKPISAANARLISAGGGNVVAAGGANAGGMAMDSAAGARATAPASAPMAPEGAIVSSGGAVSKAAPAPSASAGGGYSGNVWNHYGFGYYFGGYGYGGGQDPMALVSITEAETTGAKGSFQEVVKGVAAPVIKAWAADGRLVASNATLGNDGQVFVDPNQADVKPAYSPYGGYYGDQPGWRMTYTSPSRNELLNFYVTPTKTLIIRMRWAPLTLNPELVTVDSASAIKKLIAAIEDKSHRGEEEKSGLDYFLGTPFEQPKTPDGENTPYSKAEVVYDVPDKARWHVNLQSVLGKLVWELSYYAPNDVVYRAEPAVAVSAPAVAFQVQQVSAAKPAIARPMPMPPVDGQPGEWREGYFQNAANGMVDAATGAVIRYTRPMKHFYRDYTYQPPSPAPLPPKESPKPEPSPVPDEDTGVSEGSEGSAGSDETADNDQ